MSFSYYKSHYGSLLLLDDIPTGMAVEIINDSDQVLNVEIAEDSIKPRFVLEHGKFAVPTFVEVISQGADNVVRTRVDSPETIKDLSLVYKFKASDVSPAQTAVYAPTK